MFCKQVNHSSLPLPLLQIHFRLEGLRQKKIHSFILCLWRKVKMCKIVSKFTCNSLRTLSAFTFLACLDPIRWCSNTALDGKGRWQTSQATWCLVATLVPPPVSPWSCSSRFIMCTFNPNLFCSYNTLIGLIDPYILCTQINLYTPLNMTTCPLIVWSVGQSFNNPLHV